MAPQLPENPTPGELRLMFQNILEALTEVKDTMATKEFVNTKFDSYNERVTRLELDVKEWIKTSTAAHVELDKDSKARHIETQSDLNALEIKMDAKIKAIKDQQTEDQKELRTIRSGRVNLFIVAGLGIVGNLIVLYVSTGGFR